METARHSARQRSETEVRQYNFSVVPVAQSALASNSALADRRVAHRADRDCKLLACEFICDKHISRISYFVAHSIMLI